MNIEDPYVCMHIYVYLNISHYLPVSVRRETPRDIIFSDPNMGTNIRDGERGDCISISLSRQLSGIISRPSVSANSASL